jgi:hypothetical protein
MSPVSELSFSKSPSQVDCVTIQELSVLAPHRHNGSKVRKGLSTTTLPVMTMPSEFPPCTPSQPTVDGLLEQYLETLDRYTVLRTELSQQFSSVSKTVTSESYPTDATHNV